MKMTKMRALVVGCTGVAAEACAGLLLEPDLGLSFTAHGLRFHVLFGLGVWAKGTKVSGFSMVLGVGIIRIYGLGEIKGPGLSSSMINMSNHKAQFRV